MKTMTRLRVRHFRDGRVGDERNGVHGGDDDDDDVVLGPAVTGTLTTEWSIDGSFVASNCRIYGALRLRARRVRSRNFIVTEQQTPCEQFVLSVDLPIGVYSADATLVDAGGLLGARSRKCWTISRSSRAPSSSFRSISPPIRCSRRRRASLRQRVRSRSVGANARVRSLFS